MLVLVLAPAIAAAGTSPGSEAEDGAEIFDKMAPEATMGCFTSRSTFDEYKVCMDEKNWAELDKEYKGLNSWCVWLRGPVARECITALNEVINRLNARNQAAHLERIKAKKERDALKAEQAAAAQAREEAEQEQYRLEEERSKAEAEQAIREQEQEEQRQAAEEEKKRKACGKLYRKIEIGEPLQTLKKCLTVYKVGDNGKRQFYRTESGQTTIEIINGKVASWYKP